MDKMWWQKFSGTQSSVPSLWSLPVHLNPSIFLSSDCRRPSEKVINYKNWINIVCNMQGSWEKKIIDRIHNTRKRSAVMSDASEHSPAKRGRPKINTVLSRYPPIRQDLDGDDSFNFKKHQGTWKGNAETTSTKESYSSSYEADISNTTPRCTFAISRSLIFEPPKRIPSSFTAICGKWYCIHISNIWGEPERAPH